MAEISLPILIARRTASRVPKIEMVGMASDMATSLVGGRKRRLPDRSRKPKARVLLRSVTATHRQLRSGTITPAGRSFLRGLITAIPDAASSLPPETTIIAGREWTARDRHNRRGKITDRAMIAAASIAFHPARTARRSKIAACSLRPVRAPAMAVDGSAFRPTAIVVDEAMTDQAASLASISISRS